jgi:hypothetical protein
VARLLVTPGLSNSTRFIRATVLARAGGVKRGSVPRKDEGPAPFPE